ncbi:S-adenosyl-L-methionine-dependent methyltransferase, partial [Thozetella sp. PMI_491]
ETLPLDEEYRETVVHHHREYQKYAIDNGAYFAPVDEDEIERLQLMHGVFSVAFRGRLVFPPIQSPTRILDCGYGSASWAVDVAEQYPDCEVTAVDIYPYLPDELPANLDLQVDDLNRPTSFPREHFDLVHSRMMSGAIHANRWQNYIRDVFRILRPGGWCQLVEPYFNFQSDSGRLDDLGQHLTRWSQVYRETQEPYKNPRAGVDLGSWARAAGFVDVESRMLTLPLSGWSEDPRDREVGNANRPNIHRLLSSLAAYPFTQHASMTIDEVELLAARARNEADDPRLKKIYVCIGRKPASSRHHHRHADAHKGHHASSSKSDRHSDSRKRARH